MYLYRYSCLLPDLPAPVSHPHSTHRLQVSHKLHQVPLPQPEFQPQARFPLPLSLSLPQSHHGTHESLAIYPSKFQTSRTSLHSMFRYAYQSNANHTLAINLGSFFQSICMQYNCWTAKSYMFFHILPTYFVCTKESLQLYKTVAANFHTTQKLHSLQSFLSVPYKYPSLLYPSKLVYS